MIPVDDKPITQLPIIPTAVLMKHRVYEEFDNRFRSCARLLQSLWRQDQMLPIGTFIPRNGRKRTIGSLISTAAGTEGRNFLTPAIAETARLAVAYQERDALIDKSRLFTNLLSSMPLVLNACGPLHQDRDLAARVLRSIIHGIDIKADYGHATALHERYLAWDRVDEVVRTAVKAKTPVWPTEQVTALKTATVRPPKPKAA